MHKGLLSYSLPVCDLDEAIQVFPFALITLSKLISFTFPCLMHSLQRSAQVAFICLLWGITFLDKHNNPTGIAKKPGKISYDRLQRLRKLPAVTAEVRREAHPPGAGRTPFRNTSSVND